MKLFKLIAGKFIFLISKFIYSSEVKFIKTDGNDFNENLFTKSHLRIWKLEIKPFFQKEMKILSKMLKFFGKNILIFLEKKKNLNNLTKCKKSRNLKFETLGFT